MATQGPSNTANLVASAAEGAATTVDAAHRAAAGVAVGVLRQLQDVIGVAGFVADLGEVTVADLMERLAKFAETGERPVKS